jgi:hypothetical protein
MWFYRVEHIVVMMIGFLAGAGLAMCVAPGDVLLVVAAGIVLGFFAREFLDQSLGGDLFWPFAKTSGKKSVGPDQAVSQH